MSLDHLFVGGGVACVALGLLIYLYKLYGGPAQTRIKSVASSLRPGEAMVIKSAQPEDTSTKAKFKAAVAGLKEDAHDLAVSNIIEEYAAKQSEEIKAQMQAIFAPKAPAAPTPPQS